MSDSEQYYDEIGLVCRAESSLQNVCIGPGESHYTMPLPAPTEEDARSFLDGIGGGSLGAGQALRRIGIDAPTIRTQYKQEVENLARQIAERLEQGQSRERVARWAAEQRRQIVGRMRRGSGRTAQILYEIRDRRKYGRGGRTYENLSRAYRARGVPHPQISQRILDGASRSNVDVDRALRGASYLRHGGRVLIVVGVAVSAARIWNASDDELPRVIGEEFAGFVGGGLGAAAGAGICLLFGIATSGWGLLACGVVGGIAGGVGGSAAGRTIADGVYYSDSTTPASQMGEVIIEIPVSQIYTEAPINMCLPLHR